MEDLKLAKKVLKDKKLFLVIAKEGKILFESDSSGIDGLLQAVEKFERTLWNASAADRIVGRAAALLLAYSCMKAVYASTLSNEGLRVLEENHIAVEYESLVPRIVDRTGKDICPFERFSLTIQKVDDAYGKLKTCTENLRRAK